MHVFYAKRSKVFPTTREVYPTSLKREYPKILRSPIRGLTLLAHFIRKENPQETTYKAYICLFTCASTHGIHLELTTSLNVDAFFMAFRRFTSRRGLPSTIRTDNAKTFKRAAKELQRFTRSNVLHNHMINHRISWQFIPPKAPWRGGYWERMVKMVKQTVKKMLRTSMLNYDEMNTLLIEVERVMNSCPITYVYDDKEAVSYALTPSHLINGTFN